MHLPDRPYEFGEQDYDNGIRDMLTRFYQEYVDDNITTVRFMARAGEVAEKVCFISPNYELIVLSSNEIKPDRRQWMGSHTSMITSTSKCPVLVVPAFAKYRVWDKIWHIERQKNESTTLKKFSVNLKINLSLIATKSFDQSSFTSTLWRSIVSFIKTPKEDLRQAILETAASDQIDLIILVSHFQAAFHKFVNDSAIQIIFQFEIPVLVLPADESQLKST
jgi:nucleotide-binding universal stress UspA family protein